LQIVLLFCDFSPKKKTLERPQWIREVAWAMGHIGQSTNFFFKMDPMGP
jgi:hypothetical protein